MSAFAHALLADIRRRLVNDSFRYADNDFNYIIYGDLKAVEKDRQALATLPAPSLERIFREKEKEIGSLIALNTTLYDMLADDYSRKTLVTRSAYMVLGHLFVKFPFYVDDYFQKVNALRESLRISHPLEHLGEAAFSQPAELYDLSSAGCDFTCLSERFTLYTFVYDNLYTYAQGKTHIQVEKGDYVFDCGAAFCDTALHFAWKAGTDGRVFSYDPNEKMVSIGRHNLDLNPKYLPCVALFELGMADRSDEAAFLLNSVASRIVRAEKGTRGTASIRTTSIDHEMERLEIPKVDFIKMDIEGAELAALAGAEKTIRQFKPKLAISMYHKDEDMRDIPQFIDSLGLGYTFYLKHHSPLIFETVLYAQPS